MSETKKAKTNEERLADVLRNLVKEMRDLRIRSLELSVAIRNAEMILKETGHAKG